MSISDSDAFMFVLAGFETTPIALHLTVYMLAIHEEIQEQCRREVEEVCGCQAYSEHYLKVLHWIQVARANP
uniref:Cytochrome P450 n=1 Tax=Heterorhabditis bacteriophora TaxID=37862 RepID=A0A1I7XF93_HETBA